MNNTDKNDFFGLSKINWLHLTGEVDKSVKFARQIFSVFNRTKIIKIVNFWQNYVGLLLCNLLSITLY